MLDRLQKLAVFLHGFRWWFLSLCATVFVVLAVLDYRGHDVAYPFVLSTMWLFGFGLFVELFRRTKRLDETKRVEGERPKSLYELLESDAFALFLSWFFLFWFGFLIFTAVKLAVS